MSVGILPVFLNRSLEEVYDIAFTTQNAWKSGNLSRFEIVDYFFEQRVPPDEELLFFLPRIKVRHDTAVVVLMCVHDRLDSYPILCMALVVNNKSI